MRAHGERGAAIAPAEMWRALSDPEALGDALPNVDLVEVEGSDRFAAWVRYATGVGITPMRMDFAVQDRREGEHVRITGTGRGGDHAVRLEVDVDLAPEGSGSTVRWTADVRVLGPLRSLGQRVIPGLVKGQVDGVLAAAERLASGGTEATDNRAEAVAGAGGTKATDNRAEAVAGAGASEDEVADPERYLGGGM